MPLWAWVSIAAGLGWLFLSGSGSSRAPSTSQGSVAARTDADWQALWQTANQLGADPRVLGLILYEESGMDPGAKNTNGSSDPEQWCVGLNQFCPGTYGSWVDVDPLTYLSWSMPEQLGPIGHFWASKPQAALQTVRDLFWQNFLPATWPGPGADSSHVVNDPAILGSSYAAQVAAANPAIAQGRPTITAGDIDSYLASVAASPGWQLALEKIDANDPANAAA